jgi:predicted enzyme related to lactoylglutathione lyase
MRAQKLAAACLLAMALLGGCHVKEQRDNVQDKHPVFYFEIPVNDMDRAIKFYSAAFGFDFTRENIHGNEMAFFPLDTSASGITGGLAKGEVYKPSKDGTLIYFLSLDIDQTMSKVEAEGGKVLFPKTKAGDYGFVAEFEDSEGNRIGLNQKN